MAPVTFIGEYPEHVRIMTNCFSLDAAVAGSDPINRIPKPGLPTHCGYHIWSKETGLGKSVFTYSLAGIVAAKLGRGLAIAPIDTFDIGNLERILNHSGVNGQVLLVMKPKHSDALNDLVDALDSRHYAATVLDSAYSCMSTAVDEGGTEDANMGRDAKMVSTYARQAKACLDANPAASKVFFVTNMSFVDLAARRSFGPPPYAPARGRTLMGMTSIHIDLSQAYMANKAVRFDGGRLLAGKVVKNNFGPTNRTFTVFTVGGLGIHVGLTAVCDCIGYGLAKVVRGKVVLNDGQVFPSIQEMLDEHENEELFLPFLQALHANFNEIFSGTLVKEKEAYGGKKKKAEEVVEPDEEEAEEE